MDVRQALAAASTALEWHQPGDAVGPISAAIMQEPDNALAWNQLATARMQRGQIELAIEAAREAVRLRPDYADAQRNLALLLLTVGEYDEGWTRHVHRQQCLDFREHRRPHTQPLWKGTFPASLLVVGEQGIGDQILYASMIPEALQQTNRLVLECDPRLVPIFQRSFPRAVVVPATTPPAQQAEECLAHIPMGDLGFYLRRTPAAFPARKAYLVPPKYTRNGVKKQVQIGYATKSTNTNVGTIKSCPIGNWNPMFQHNAAWLPLDTPDTHKNLELLAAQIDSCDAVVTVSNTIAHMAGALGKPTFVMLGGCAGRYWYWGAEGETTPWYPSVRIARQLENGDWTHPIAEAEQFVRGLCVSSENPSS